MKIDIVNSQQRCVSIDNVFLGERLFSGGSSYNGSQIQYVRLTTGNRASLYAVNISN